MAEVKKGFTTPPEVLDYFNQKTDRPAFSWLDVWGQEHAYAFTVAKATDTELLNTFKSSIATALENGEGFENWKIKIEADLRRMGWWGPRTVADPTGIDPDTIVDFSRPRRLRTIFWSNMNAARAAGQWERMQRTKKALPYILYVRTAAADPREEHLTWVGTILPVDHQFWKTHFPPNGWGCLCSVRQITGREAERLLGTTPKDDDAITYTDRAPETAYRRFVNRRTGKITRVPDGIDPGWHTNPGLARARTLTQRLQDTLIEAGEKTARNAIRTLFDSGAPRVLAGLDEHLRLPVAVAPRLQAGLDAKSGLIVADNRMIRSKTAKHREVGLDTFAVVQDILDQGTVVDEGRGAKRTVFWQIGTTWWEVVIARSANGYLRIQTLHVVKVEDVRSAFAKAGLELPEGLKK